MRTQRVQLATFMFRSMAKTWWCTVEATNTGISDDGAWDTFKRVFSKFIPDHIWVQKLAKFVQLTRGSMTVQQFEISFNQLLRFIIELVDTPVERIRCFIRGLKPKIRKDRLSVDLPTFEENMKAAFWFEDIERERSGLTRLRTREFN